MGPDPKPDCLTVLYEGDSTVCQPDANGVNRLCGIDALEVQTWVKGILLEVLVRRSRLSLNVLRQSAEFPAELRSRP
jgi:hypothetical protein